MGVDNSGRVILVESVTPLHPEEQTVEDMLTGWWNQQLCRNLQLGTIEQRQADGREIHRLHQRVPVDLDTGDGRRVLRRFTLDPTSHAVDDPKLSNLAETVLCLHQQPRLRLGPALRATIRNTPRPGVLRMEQRSTRPGQRVDADQTGLHQDRTARVVFDHADTQVETIAGIGRKGWLPAYRDAVMLKIAYSYGLRFNELRHLQTVDFARNPHAREFGRFGVVNVRYGKAKRGSPPKRRSVLTVFDWTPGIIEDWMIHGQPYLDAGLDLFPSERGALVAESTLIRRFRRYCTELSLSPGLDLHSLRRSYATHLIEDGWDPLFVQHQMGHEHASTTSLYTSISSDFRTTTLRRALDATVADALGLGEEGEIS